MTKDHVPSDILANIEEIEEAIGDESLLWHTPLGQSVMRGIHITMDATLQSAWPGTPESATYHRREVLCALVRIQQYRQAVEAVGERWGPLLEKLAEYDAEQEALLTAS
jgi:hypothetical protein